MALFVRSSLIAAALLVASGTAPARGAETYQPDPKLLEAATKEGEVVLYTTHIVDQIVRPLIKAFQVHAPRVQVKYVRADGLALVVRLTNEARIPSWPMEMPSLTAMVTNSIGNPPASRTPALARFASRSSDMLQGVTSFQLLATPTWGLSQSSSVIPTARNMARAGARSNPCVTSRLRNSMAGG